MEGQEEQAKQRREDGVNAENRVLFFAKVLRSATDDEVRELFAQFGKVYEVNLFRAFQGAPTSKGCGLVTMGTHDEALATIEALDSKHTWEGMDSTMVVKWMDVAMQRRRREQHLAAVRQGLVPNFTIGPDWRVPVVPSGYMLANMAPPGGMPMHGPGPGGLSMPHDMESPPVGCEPDVIKLFVGNLPKSCSEQQLLALFETVGKVVELVIVRDKVTQAPKGSAFVWYASRAAAERAILQFNLRHCMPEPTGEQDRPLVVRKAKARASAGQAGGIGGPAAMHMGMLAGGMAPQHLLDPVSMGSMGMRPGQGHHMAMHYNPNNHLGVVQQGMMGRRRDGMPMQPSGGHMGMMPMAPMQYPGTQLGGAGLMLDVHGSGPPQDVHAGLYDYDAPQQHGAGGALDGEPYLQPGADPNPVAASLVLNQQEMSMVNQYLFSIQSMSGAQLSITPGAPGLFHMVITGALGQVENARSLLGSLLKLNA